MRHMSVTISGSFTRHLAEIQKAVEQFTALGVRVLSPEHPIIVDSLDGFLFVASDKHRSVRLVQDRHLASIANSDFLWLETPDGHVGQSAAFELGFALAAGIPIYSTSLPMDLTMRQYVRKVPSLASAVALAGISRETPGKAHTLPLLVDPIAATDVAAASVQKLREMLTRETSVQSSVNLTSAISDEQANIARVIGFRTPQN